MLGEITNWGKLIAGKINGIFTWGSSFLAKWLKVSEINIHQILIFALALWISSIIFKTDKFSIKFWVLAIALFMLFRYLGM